VSDWTIDARWDRPAKLMAQHSTHYLLLRIVPGGTRPAAGSAPASAATAPAAITAANAHSPRLAIAIDSSRSMDEAGRFAACAQAAAQLAERYGATEGGVRAALFSKAASPLLLSGTDGATLARQLSASLAQAKLRSVSRYDLALEWLAAELAAAPADTPRVAVLLGDGGATDEGGYAPAQGALQAQAAALAAQGIRLWTAGDGGESRLLERLAQAGGGVYCSPEELPARLAAAYPPPQATAGEAALPSASASPGGMLPRLGLRLDSRQHGLVLRRACRLRPDSACLTARIDGSGWGLDAGELPAWQELELLLEWQLPPAAFGTAEGPDPIVAARLLDTAGQRLGEAVAGLDYTTDPRRAQQLLPEIDQARRLWELAGLDAWTAQAADGALRRTGVLPPLPGQASAPPAGGVPQ
jgi:hypothetical protein